MYYFLALAECITIDSIDFILNHCNGLIYILINEDNHANLVRVETQNLDYLSPTNTNQHYKTIMTKHKERIIIDK